MFLHQLNIVAIGVLAESDAYRSRSDLKIDQTGNELDTLRLQFLHSTR